LLLVHSKILLITNPANRKAAKALLMQRISLRQQILNIAYCCLGCKTFCSLGAIHQVLNMPYA